MFKKSNLASCLDPARCESETTVAGLVGECEKTAASQRGGHYCLQGGCNLVTRARPRASENDGEEQRSAHMASKHTVPRLLLLCG